MNIPLEIVNKGQEAINKYVELSERKLQLGEIKGMQLSV